jgi:hydroxymethylbilane synthase
VKQSIILGSRGSELALMQTRMVEKALRVGEPSLKIEVRIIKTSGDEVVPGADESNPQNPGPAGRKGLFTSEIERALIAGTIDVAVHSAKDLPSALGPGTHIAAVLPRAAVDDVLVSKNGCDLESLPRDGVVATGSVRRRHQLRWKRPDLKIADLRGNVPTRLRKLTEQQWDGAILARAGLDRLGYLKTANIDFEGGRLVIAILPSDVFVPAGGQGIIAIQTRSDDHQTRQLVEAINDSDTSLCLQAEREFLRLLHADCNQPVGVFAIVTGNLMKMRGQVFRLEATVPHADSVEGNRDNVGALAAELLQRIND